jgi:hypothetical protein
VIHGGLFGKTRTGKDYAYFKTLFQNSPKSNWSEKYSCASKFQTRAFQILKRSFSRSSITFEEKRKKVKKEYQIKTPEKEMILLHLLYSNVFAARGRLFWNAIENGIEVKYISSSRNILSGFTLHCTISVHVVVP